jgi:hypothetical protein
MSEQEKQGSKSASDIEEVKRKTKAYKEQFNSTTKSMVPCTCGVAQVGRTGHKKHKQFCSLLLFRSKWSHAAKKVGVADLVEAIKELKRQMPVLGKARVHQHHPSAPGVDGDIIFAKMTDGTTGVRAAKRRKLETKWVSVGNKCGDCGGHGKLLPNRLVTAGIRPAWEANIANMASPSLKLCSC